MDLMDLGEGESTRFECGGKTFGVMAPSEPVRVGTSRLSASCCGGAFGSGGSGAPPPYKFQSVSRDNSSAARASLLIGVDPGLGGEFGPGKVWNINFKN